MWICSRAVSRSKNDEAWSCTPIRGSSRRLRGHGDWPSTRDRAGVRLAQALDHLQRRRLAGAVGPEDAEELPLGDLEVDPVDRLELPVGHREVAHLDRCHATAGDASSDLVDRRPGTARCSSCAESRAAWSSSSVRPTSWTDSRQAVGREPARDRGGGVAGDVPERDVRDRRHRRAATAPTVPVPSRTPTAGGRCAIVGVSSTSQSSKTRLAFADTFSVCASAQSRTRRHPGAHPVGLPGAPLEPVVVLDLVGLGADARRRTAARTRASGRGSAGRPRARRGRGR